MKKKKHNNDGKGEREIQIRELKGTKRKCEQSAHTKMADGANRYRHR